MAGFDPDAWPARWVLALIAEDNLHAFYTSSPWESERESVLIAAKRRCHDCERKTPALVTTATTVHHVHPLRERPDLALSRFDEYGKRQLVPLCPGCHWNRHHQRKTVTIPERW